MVHSYKSSQLSKITAAVVQFHANLLSSNQLVGNDFRSAANNNGTYKQRYFSNWRGPQLLEADIRTNLSMFRASSLFRENY